MSADCKQGMAELLPRTGPRMKRIAMEFGIPPEETEDLAQEAFLGLVRNWDRLVSPDAWLLRAFYLLCCAHRGRRRQRRQWLVYLEPQSLADLAPPQRPEQERQERLLDLMALGALLSRREQALLLLRYGLGLSVAETAARLGCCASSIGKMSARAIQRARARVPRSEATADCLR